MKPGIDIVTIDRIRKLAKHPQFMEKVFTEKEQLYIMNAPNAEERMAGFFAAKEAISKALGTGIGKLSFLDMEIDHTENGEPFVCFTKDMDEEVDISISHERDVAVAIAMRKRQRNSFELNRDLCMSLLTRDFRGYKTQYGKIAVIGGSLTMPGAVGLALHAAFRSGSGLVVAVVPKSIAPVVQMMVKEAIVYGIEDRGRGFFPAGSGNEIAKRLQGFDCVAIGPGMGRDSGMPLFLRDLVESLDVPLVLDADALYALAQDRDILRGKSQSCVITPHEQEMARLTGHPLQEIRLDREKIAREFAEMYSTYVVLKGKDTIVTDGVVHFLNSTGNPGMATAGSGDVLTGMICAMIGYGYKHFLAVRLAVYLHGLAGDLAAGEKGEDGMMASDIVEAVPYALKMMHACGSGE